MITGNEADRQGGGIWSGVGVNLDIQRSRIFENVTDNSFQAGKGGGICMLDGSLDMLNVRLHDNESDLGGALYLGGGGNPPTTPVRGSNLIFHDNLATRSGGAVHFDPFVGTLGGNVLHEWRHCTVSFNRAPMGSGFYIGSGTAMSGTNTQRVRFLNTILWDNQNANSDNLYYVAGGTTTSIFVDVDYTDLGPFTQAGTPGNLTIGTGRIDVDPKFTNAPGRDLTLVANATNPSPCIDAGATAEIGDEFLDLDENGAFGTGVPLTLDFVLDHRALDFPGVGDASTLVDMGAYEEGYRPAILQ